MGKLKQTLVSRKFWVAVVSSILFALQGDYVEAIGVWLGWAVVEGLIDAKRAEGVLQVLPAVIDTTEVKKGE